MNELNVPILCMGLKNMVVAASVRGNPGIDKEQSSYIKPYVNQFNSAGNVHRKILGSFRVLDVKDHSMTIKVTLNPGHGMNYHSHDFRDEVWTVIAGEYQGFWDVESSVKPGDVLTCKQVASIRSFADTELQVIEVQIGAEISVDDKHKYEYRKD